MQSASTLLARAHELASSLATHTPTHEAAHQLTPHVVDALRAGGFLQVLLPRELGGHEIAPADYVTILETLAAGDAATAWCVMTASTTTLLSAYVEREAATLLWPTAVPAFHAGVFAPSGRATADADGGLRLRGRWSYASGSRHADWFAVGAIDDGTPGRHVVCFLPADGARVVDNWDTLGLGGTGSHDLAVDDVLVSPARIARVFDRAPWTDAPLYRMPLFGVLATGIAACGLGVARGALAQIAARLAAPPVRPSDKLPSTMLDRYATLSAQLASARAYLIDVNRRALERALDGAIDGATRGELRLAASHVAEQCAQVVRGAFHLGGGGGIRADAPLNRALRDAETLLTHRMVADRVRPAAARAMLGIGPVPADL